MLVNSLALEMVKKYENVLTHVEKHSWKKDKTGIRLVCYFIFVCASHIIFRYTYIRRPVPSTNQALPSCFYFRIPWILMEHRFLFLCSLGFLQGLRSLKHWLLQKLSMKSLDQKFRFPIKKYVFLCPNISRTWSFKVVFLGVKKFTFYKYKDAKIPIF